MLIGLQNSEQLYRKFKITCVILWIRIPGLKRLMIDTCRNQKIDVEIRCQ